MERYDVGGMSCAACSARVEKAVGSVPGVTSCSVSLLTNSMTVEGSAGADKIIQNAEAQKQARIAEAEGQVARFNAMYEQYAQNPLITKQRMFYEALESVLPDLKVIITDGSTQTMLPLESFTAEAPAD